MKAEQVLSRLAGVKKTRGGGWMARCPAHDDAKASLSITIGDDRRTLLYCHAGCDTENKILPRLGLRAQDLFDDAKAERMPEPGQELAPEPSRLVDTYDYRDEGGKLLYQAVRFHPKDFRQRRPVPGEADRWVWSLGDVRRVVFKMPDLIDRATVYWVEGEKDALRLWEDNIAATTGAGGANAWRDEYAEQLLALGCAEVVILPDNDTPGAAYASQVQAGCLRVGLRVKIVDLPDVGVKGDVSDWLAAGHDVIELAGVVALVPWTSMEPPMPDGLIPQAVILDDLLERLETGGFPPHPTGYAAVDHILGGGFANGELIVLGARAGVGKSAMALEIAQHIGASDETVMIVSREMSTVALARRLILQNTSHVRSMQLRFGRPTTKNAHDLMRWDEAMAEIRKVLPALKARHVWYAPVVDEIDALHRMVEGFRPHPPLGLIVVDYLQMLHAEGKEEGRQEVEAVSKGLKRLAMNRDIPVLALSALSRPAKGEKEKPPVRYDLRESGAIEHDADVIILLHRLFKEDATTCIVDKNREGDVGVAQLLFRAASLRFQAAAEGSRV